MKYYVMILNKALGQWNRHIDTNYKVKVENIVELPIKLVEIIRKVQP